MALIPVDKVRQVEAGQLIRAGQGNFTMIKWRTFWRQARSKAPAIDVYGLSLTHDAKDIYI